MPMHWLSSIIKNYKNNSKNAHPPLLFEKEIIKIEIKLPLFNLTQKVAENYKNFTVNIKHFNQTYIRYL